MRRDVEPAIGAPVLFEEIMEVSARVFEALGVAVILFGLVYALFRASRDNVGSEAFFIHARRNFGRPLLLGLEILVAADIIETITVDRSLDAALILGLLVLVRILLSFSLDVEIDGMLPWKRTEFEMRREGASGSS